MIKLLKQFQEMFMSEISIKMQPLYCLAYLGLFAVLHVF